MLEQLINQESVKYGFGVMMLIYVIERLLKIIMFLLAHRKTPIETERRDTSRDKIAESHNMLKSMKPCISGMKDLVDDVHEVVMAKSEGVPLVYNKGLEKSIEKLNFTMSTLATAVTKLGGRS
jgi:hypothetical protein